MLETSRSLLHRTAAAVSWWTSPDRASGEPAPLSHTIEAIAETAIEGGYSVGVSIGVCLPIKSPALAAFGHANLETATRATEASLFRIGACTRQFTAAALLLLAEQNMLRLTDSIERFLPGKPHAHHVTLRDLLIGDQGAYALLGRIVEHVTAESFTAFVAENLLRPAGMAASRFADATQITPQRTAGYRLAGGQAYDFRNAGPGHGALAADGLYTTAGDLLLWNRALYLGRLLAPSTVDLMSSSCLESEACQVLAPFLDRHASGFGFEIGRIFGRRAIWQRGQAPGFDAWLFHFPDDRTDLALLTNTERGAATILEPMLRAILRA